MTGSENRQDNRRIPEAESVLPNTRIGSEGRRPGEGPSCPEENRAAGKQYDRAEHADGGSGSAVKDEFGIRKKRFQFIRLMSYFKPFLPKLALSLLLAFLVNAAALVRPYIIKYVIDGYIAEGNYHFAGILLMGILYLAAVLLGSAFGYSQTYILTHMGQRIMYNIRNQIFSHIQRMSAAFFDRNSSGRLLTRVTNDVEALNDLYSGVMVDIFKSLILIIGIIVVMVLLDPVLALVSVACIPVMAGVMVAYKIAARKNFVRMKGMIAKINGFLAENISGMKLVQIFHREKEKYEELEKLDREYFRYSLREIILNGFSRPVVDIINNLTVAAVILVGMSRIMAGQLEIGVLFAFIAYIKQFFEPISELAEKYTTIQSSIISSERVFDILDTTEFQEDMESGRIPTAIRGEIEFKNVWFAYNDEEWVLKDVSFRIAPGETAAFVGATGSGKSTIISLMARFYDIQKGQILIDGVDIREYNLRDLRRQIAVVLQDVFLFSGDIRSNIRLNNADITDEEIESAARSVNADRFIESLPGKYSEEVKERGCTFSVGQRQLISFARAVVRKPSILVLDEATASVDTETETEIKAAMREMSRNRTCIIIAHRLSTIVNADKIMVIHMGRLRETGTHDELLKLNGIYSRLYRLESSRITA